MAIDLAARGPGHRQCRRSQQHEPGRGFERQAVCGPAAEQGQRQQIVIHKADVTDQNKLPRDADPAMTAQRGKGHQERPSDDAGEGPVAEPGSPAGRWRLGFQFGGETALQTFSYRPRGLRRATDSFDFFLREFKRGKFLNAAADESFEERLGSAYLVHVGVRVVTPAHAQAGDRAAIRTEGGQTFRRSAVTRDVVGLRRGAHGEAQQSAGGVEHAQARVIGHHTGGVAEQKANFVERDRIGKTQRGCGAREPLLDALGDGEAGQRGATDALDFRRFAGLPTDEGAEETGVVLYLLDVFIGVARAQEFKTGDGAAGVERDEEVIGPGITNDMVRLWRGGEQASDGVAAGVCDKVQAALGVTKLNPVGCRKKLARLPERDGRAALGLAPARLLVYKNNDDHQHAGAVKAQEQRQFQNAGHRTRHVGFIAKTSPDFEAHSALPQPSPIG